MRKAALIGILVLAAVAPACSAKTTTKDVLAQLEKTFAGVRDYKADATASVNSPQLHMSDCKATIYFKRPDKVKIVAKEGLPLIPNEAVPGDPALWIEQNFTSTYAGSGSYKGQSAEVLKLRAKTDSVPPAMTLWVEKRRGVILAAESDSDGTRIKSEWSYKLVDGKYWLPSQVKVDMSGMLSRAAYDPHQGKNQPPKPMKGTAIVNITNYVVNKGVPDSIFRKMRH